MAYFTGNKLPVMIRSLKILALLASPLTLFSQQAEMPPRMESTNQPPRFGPLRFREDSVTIIGEYKNFTGGPPFKVAVMEWISNNQATYSAPIDSNGHFRLTFPMPAPGEIHIDFGRASLWNVAIPGETMYLSADMNKIEGPKRGDTAAITAWKEHTATIFEGSNARLHNDIYRYWRHQAASSNQTGYGSRQWNEQFKLDAFCDTVHGIFRSRMQFLQDYHRRTPLEARALQFIETTLRYSNASVLTQRYYYVLWNDRVKHEKRYFATIDSIVRPVLTTGYLAMDYRTVLRDIHSHISTKALNLPGSNIDSLHNEYILHPVERSLTQAWLASIIQRQGHVLDDSMMTALRASVKEPYLIKQLTQRNDALKALQADNALLAGARLITEFPELKTSAEIYRHITAPYRGKVIYLDIWGTWCIPCREAMQHMPPVKEQYAGKDVVFLYLANRSPMEAWKNTIKQHRITGANVVHYNLPAAMQQLFEKDYLDEGFPTYLLIDKEGKLVTKKAPRPHNIAELITAINKLL